MVATHTKFVSHAQPVPTAGGGIAAVRGARFGIPRLARRLARGIDCMPASIFR